jgi:hypothetical protein
MRADAARMLRWAWSTLGRERVIDRGSTRDSLP